MDGGLKVAKSHSAQHKASGMTLRSLRESHRLYYEFNREERHLAAILFHVLAQPENVRRLLKFVIGCDWEVHQMQFGIYFEYSLLRDLWHTLGSKAEANKDKQKLILEMLPVGGKFSEEFLGQLSDISDKNPGEFNKYFLGRGSKEFIQSPANWQLQTMGGEDSKFDNDSLIAACKLKWAFKAKPDIVIHTDAKRAICIELKLESGEGSYPANSGEIEILKHRSLYGKDEKFPFPIEQTYIQKFLMKELLGLDTQFLLVTRGRAADHGREENEQKAISWYNLFDKLDLNLPPFMHAALRLATDKNRSSAIAIEQDSSDNT
jgi:hypothetical protein